MPSTHLCRSRAFRHAWFIAVSAIALSAGCQAYDRGRYAAALDGAITDADASMHEDRVFADVHEDLPTADEEAAVTDVPVVDVPADVPVVDVPMEAGLDSTSCDDRHSGAIFCDGFESPTLAAWIDVSAMDGSVMRTTAHPYRGAAALHAETTAMNGHAMIFAAPLHGVTSGELYARGYYYFPSTVTISGFVIMNLSENQSPYASIDLQLATNGRLGSYGTPGMQYVDGAAGAIVPRDRWVCLELHITLSTTAGAVEFFLDGVRAGGGSGFSTVPAAGISVFQVGLPYIPADQGAASADVDEVVVDTSPIGCD